MRIDFLGLEAFVAIAERGSFNRAAAHLNLSQTALSHRMKKLEDDLGVRLLTRTTRQVTLTPAGLELLPRAQAVMADLTSSFVALRERGREQLERIAIGCLPTIAVAYLPVVLDAFRKAHPRVGVRVYDNSATEIAEHVQAGRAEFGLTIVAANRWDLEIRPLMKEPFVLVCPDRHPLARKVTVNWQALEGEPLVRIAPQTGNRVLIDDALGSRRENLDWRYEVQHVATAVGMARAGIGLTIVPRLALGVVDTAGIVALPLRNPGVTRTLGIVSKRGIPPSPPAATLLDLIVSALRSAGAASDS
ncbi:LysR family transcriptional regulator [Phreatobacter sp. AB_2022a]|uniref:LysR family transcriptional regulator n=1 Tax=Phreatobacter sp. AB_2022a TaxID=3003134 RepID=UPI002286D484|nr:LysR family transcriptional regulator [Phreatobacter sp. AB_2022a]MCZ0737690.1 LysR family transcriptional regulator [Phreatobacter sp. AB_2022a]